MRGIDAPYVVHGIPNGPTQEIRFALSEFRGRRLVDLRVFVRTTRHGWMPTQEGCTVGLDQLDQLQLAITKLRQAAELE